MSVALSSVWTWLYEPISYDNCYVMCMYTESSENTFDTP